MLTAHQFIPQLSLLYQEPHRTYHSLEHIQSLKRMILTGEYINMVDVDKCNAMITRSNNVTTDIIEQYKNFLQLVAWFHDCYYDPYLGSPHNEQESAKIFHALTPSINFPKNMEYDDQILEVGNYKHYDERLKQRVTDAILATSLHLTNIKTQNLPVETLIFLDLDMIGFSDSNMMARNDKQIRKEYYKTDDKEYLKGRMSFLTALLSKPTIYYTLKSGFEDAARYNIKLAIDACQAELNKM